MMLILLALVGGLLVGGVGTGAVWYARSQQHEVEAEVEALTADTSLDVEEGEVFELEPVDVRSSFLGLVRAWRRRAKERRLAEKGYIKWYRLDSQLQAPTWVKPVQSDGRGIGKVSASDGPYYFDRNAMVTDSRTGAWVAMHEVGDADPINLRDTAFPGIPVDRVEELLNMEAEAEKPGFFENLDLSATTLVILMIVLAFLAYAATQVM